MLHRLPILAACAAFCLASAGCGGSAGSTSGSALPPVADAPPISNATLAFVGVDVVPMDSEILLIDRTVIVRVRRIARVGLRGDVAIPDDAEQIDGAGLILMPGLADMHVHLHEEDLPIYLANGITTVRNMWGYGAIRSMAERISAGTLAGPTIYSTSPGIDGPPPKWDYTQIVETPAEAEATVDRLVADGWTMLKVYQDLRLDVYDAVVAAAKRHGVPFMGHVPHRVGLQHVLASGQASLEHLGGYDVALGGVRATAGWLNMDASKIPEVVSWTWEAGAYVCPTMVVVKQITRNNASGADVATVDANRRELLGALHRGYVPLLLGTDAGIDVVPPGSSLHEELREFTASGLTPYEALAAGTTVAARFLGQENEFGAVREGLRADLVLLEANPLEDVRAASHSVGVLVNGDWYTGTALGQLTR